MDTYQKIWTYDTPKIWTLVPETIKNYYTLKSFKQKIRK